MLLAAHKLECHHGQALHALIHHIEPLVSIKDNRPEEPKAACTKLLARMHRCAVDHLYALEVLFGCGCCKENLRFLLDRKLVSGHCAEGSKGAGKSNDRGVDLSIQHQG